MASKLLYGGVVVLLLLALALAAMAAVLPTPPEQLHIAPGKDAATSMTISWLQNYTTHPVVQLGLESGGNLSMEVHANTTVYTYCDYNATVLHAFVAGLQAVTTYFYRVGDLQANVWSDVRSFRTLLPRGDSTPFNFAVVGDLGQTQDSLQTVLHVKADASNQFLLLCGDLSYADGDPYRWDSWGRLIETVASRRPWIVSMGNHEIETDKCDKSDFKHATARFRMPGFYGTDNYTDYTAGNFYYSVDIGSVHIIAMTNFVDYAANSPQNRWLLQDLAAVDRNITPWIIAMFHAPWYNSNAAHHNETEELVMRAVMEQTFFNNHVNLVFEGHVHAYERCYPTYQNQTNPLGTTYVTIGEGGNREGHYKDWLEQPSWSAFRDGLHYGHGEVQIANRTHLRFLWHRNQDDERVIGDSVWIENTYFML